MIRSPIASVLFALILSCLSLASPFVPQEPGNSSYIDCSDLHVVYDDEFAEWAGALAASSDLDSAAFVFTQCHSGGMLDDLAAHLADTIPVALLSAAAWNESGWVCPTDAPADLLRACGLKTGGVSYYVATWIEQLLADPSQTIEQLARAVERHNPAGRGGPATDPRVAPGDALVDTPEHPQALFLNGGDALQLGATIAGRPLPEDRRWALLFVGDAFETWAIEDLERMYDTLLDLGYTEDRIIVLAGAENVPSRHLVDPLLEEQSAAASSTPQTLPAFVDREATRAELRDTFDTLPRLMPPGSQLLFWTTGHGSSTVTLPWEEAPTLEMDQLTYGRLESGDLILPDNTYADLYRFHGTVGDQLRVTLASYAFDAYLWIYDAERQVVVTGDDELNVSDAQVTFTVDETGAYYALVNSYGTGSDATGPIEETGSYTLVLDHPAVQLNAGAATSLLVGSPRDGRLDTTDAVDRLGAIVDVYEVELEADRLYEIAMTSEAVDSFIALFDADGAPLGAVDDAAGQLDAVVWYAPPATAPVTLHATSFAAGERGEYALAIREGASSLFGGAPGIATGETVVGQLEANDARLADAYGDVVLTDWYGYTPDESGTIYMELRSDRFDSYLRLFDHAGRLLSTDDDGGGNSDARIAWDVIDSETYLIGAASFWSNEGGEYVLSISDEPLGPALPEPVGEISIGERVVGQLESADGHLEDGTPADVYTFRAVGPTSVMIEMTSDALDAYLYLYDAAGTLLAENDDGGFATDSLITYTLTDAGTYRIVANTYYTGDSGEYILTLEEQDAP